MSLNLVILNGNLGHDPEIRTLQDGTQVADISLATNKKMERCGRNPQRRTPMGYDALLCPVIGVVTPYFRLFEQWKRDVGYQTYGKDAKFVQLRRMEDVVGRYYFTIEKGYKHYEIDSDVYDAAVLRVR